MTITTRYTVYAGTFLVGIGVGELLTPTFFILFCGILLAILIHHISTLASMRLGALILLICIIGSGYSRLRAHEVTSQDIDYYNGTTGTLIGSITSPPDSRESHQKVTVTIISFDDKRVEGKVLLLVSRDIALHYNDTIEFSCSLETPTPIEDFAYDKYLARFSIYSICAFPKSVEILVSDSKRGIGQLFTVRTYFERHIESSLPEPQSSLLKGILFGDKRGMGTHLTEVFQRTGLTHIVALSGFNIAILVGLCITIGPYLYLSRRLLFPVVTIILVIFILMTGASPSVIRAGMTAWVVLVAYEIRRPVHPENVLLTVALVMVLINPKIIIWDIGWQLSFITTYALIAIVPLIQRYVRHLPSLYGIRDASIMTMVAIAVTSPLIIWHFQGLSLIALVANILIVPVIPFIMVVGGLTALLGYSAVALLWSAPAWLLLTYMVACAEYLSALPFAFISLPRWTSGVALLMLVVSLYNLRRSSYVE